MRQHLGRMPLLNFQCLLLSKLSRHDVRGSISTLCLDCRGSISTLYSFLPPFWRGRWGSYSTLTAFPSFLEARFTSFYVPFL